MAHYTYQSNDGDAYPSHGGPHPTSNCADVIREWLTSHLDDIRDGTSSLKPAQWRTAISDAGATSMIGDPTEEIGLIRRIQEQINHASRTQLAIYFEDYYPDGDCPECGAIWHRRRRR